MDSPLLPSLSSASSYPQRRLSPTPHGHVSSLYHGNNGQHNFDEEDDGWGAPDESDLLMSSGGPQMGGLRIDDEDVTITRPGQNAVPYEVTQSQIRTRFQEDDQPRVERNQGEEKQEKKKTGRGKNRFSLFVAPRHSDDEDADEVPERREIRAAATTTKTKLPESAYLFQNDKAHHYENENVYEEHDTDLAALDRIDGPGHAHGHAHGQEQAHEHDKDRDARLRECLFELKKMNSVFDTFLDALENARGHNERLAQRTQHTGALLDQYIALLGQAEHTQRLVLNERWHGSSDDAAQIAIQAQEQANALEAEQLRIQRERESLEQRQREASERAAAREKAGGSGRLGTGIARPGVRTAPGVPVAGRGTSMVTRGARGRVTSTTRRPTTTPDGSSIPTSSTTSGLRKPSAGISGVRSSGYGPRGRS